MTRERFEAPSLVICNDETMAGGDSGDLRNTTTAAKAASTTKLPATSHGARLGLGGGAAMVRAVANMARIRSFESGTRCPAGATVKVCPDSTSRRRRCRSALISAALW